MVDLDEPARLFERQTAIFLDARPPNQYDDGHIPGAMNLPWQEVDRYFIEMADRLEGSGMIITYCDGESCELSHELALFMKEMGFTNVRVKETFHDRQCLAISGGFRPYIAAVSLRTRPTFRPAS